MSRSRLRGGETGVNLADAKRDYQRILAAFAEVAALRDFLTVLTRDYPATVERLRRESHSQDGKRVAALREHLVPPAAWQLLEADCDAYDYEWIARLLDELGLDDALPELARRALASDDPEIRRVGERVRQEFLPHSGEPGGQQSR